MLKITNFFLVHVCVYDGDKGHVTVHMCSPGTTSGIQFSHSTILSKISLVSGVNGMLLASWDVFVGNSSTQELGFTDVCYHNKLFTWVPGIQTQVFRLVQWAFLPTEPFPWPQLETFDVLKKFRGVGSQMASKWRCLQSTLISLQTYIIEAENRHPQIVIWHSYVCYRVLRNVRMHKYNVNKIKFSAFQITFVQCKYSKIGNI